MEDLSTIERYMKRLKLTFSKNAYKELIDGIRQSNRDIREVTHQHISLEPTKRKRRSRRPITNLRLIRAHATSLYQVLMNESAWKCRCKLDHLASLRLEARPQTVEEARADMDQKHVFRILTSVTKDVDGTSETAQWEDIGIVPSLRNAMPKEELRTEPVPQQYVNNISSYSYPELSTYATNFPESDHSHSLKVSASHLTLTSTKMVFRSNLHLPI